MAPPLEKLDPAEAWAPAPTEIWNFTWARHLYRRAAFGAPPLDRGATRSTWDALHAAVDQGMEASVERLMAGGAGLEPFDKLLDGTAAQIARSSQQLFIGPQLEKLQGWWLYRMLFSPHPLRERMTLLWHNHFATSAAKVQRLVLMAEQNMLLRRHALGNFAALLADVSRDPAMLLWLDSNSNVRTAPNENYARELMELFSLGVGNYTETDIREAARAFTGWGTAGGKFAFNELLHDDGRKTVLGQSGPLGGDDVVRVVLEQPAAPRFIARKLFRELISQAADPPDRLIEPLARQLRETNWDISACVRTMLRSRLMFSEYAYRQRIKSPVEYVVGLLRSFDARMSMEELAYAMRGLGQALFAPPNVKGWDGGATWLNSATLVARHNLAYDLLHGKIELVGWAGWNNKPPAERVDALLTMLLDGEVDDDARQMLRQFVAQADPTDAQRLRDAAHLITTMPEFQLA